LIAGASAYAREWDYTRMRKIADQHEAYLMADMAHISGLVAVQVKDGPMSASLVLKSYHRKLLILFHIAML